MSTDPLDGTDTLGDPASLDSSSSSTSTATQDGQTSSDGTGSVVVFSDDEGTIATVTMTPNGPMITSTDDETITFTEDEGLTFDPEDIWNQVIAGKDALQAVADRANANAAALTLTSGVYNEAAGSFPDLIPIFEQAFPSLVLGASGSVQSLIGTIAQYYADSDPPRPDTGAVTVFTRPAFRLAAPLDVEQATWRALTQDGLLAARSIAMFTIACERYQGAVGADFSAGAKGSPTLSPDGMLQLAAMVLNAYATAAQLGSLAVAAEGASAIARALHERIAQSDIPVRPLTSVERPPGEWTAEHELLREELGLSPEAAALVARHWDALSEARQTDADVTIAAVAAAAASAGRDLAKASVTAAQAFHAIGDGLCRGAIRRR